MLYKQAWEELKVWVKQQTLWPEQKVCTSAKEETKNILVKMKQLEKRWKIIPPNGRVGEIRRKIDV